MSQVISAETLQAAQQRPHGAYTAGLASTPPSSRTSACPARSASSRGGSCSTRSARSSPPRRGGTACGGRSAGSSASSGGTPEATLVGLGQKSSLVNAALYNGTLGYYCDIEAHHPGAIMHGPAIVVPAALAAAEARGRERARTSWPPWCSGVDVACG